jgi:TnpA family transposase
MTDTAGVSDVVSGLFGLLDYQFSPRLADIGGARFWQMDPTADYGGLNAIARARVPAQLIVRNWDDLLRVAGSLHQGTVSASELLRSILRSTRPSPLARAVFHGQRGELRQHYREGQEDQLGALGLVVNAIVLWNTLYLEAVLKQLRDGGAEMRHEDVARRPEALSRIRRLVAMPSYHRFSRNSQSTSLGEKLT